MPNAPSPITVGGVHLPDWYYQRRRRPNKAIKWARLEFGLEERSRKCLL